MPEWLGIPAAFIAWIFALYVFLVAPKTTAARLLVALLVVDGIAVISSYRNSFFIDPVIGGIGELQWAQIHQASDWLVIACYLAFIGVTVRSPLTRPLRSPGVRWALLAAASVLAVWMLFLDMSQLTAMMPALYPVVVIALTWGFASAVHAWMIAPDEASRARARAFTLAFGIRDLIWVITFIVYTAIVLKDLPEGGLIDSANAFAYALAVIVYVPLVAYGMLRTQLFDIDLRLKRTIKRSTVAAAFVAAYFLVSETAATFLSNQLGTVLGLVCTAALIFFMEPIQRAAQRFSDAAMPNTRATPEYETYRKLQVYEAALHAALEHGGISSRERQVLNSLIQSMGIDAQAAEALERDALART